MVTIIPPGVSDQMNFTRTATAPVLNSYIYQNYALIPSCDDNNDSDNMTQPPTGVTQATILFIAESVDNTKPAGIWCLDDVYFQ